MSDEHSTLDRTPSSQIATTRRNFLFNSGLGVAGAVLAHVSAPNHKARLEDNSYNLSAPELQRTVGQTIAMSAAQAIINSFLLRRGINIGQSGNREENGNDSSGQSQVSRASRSSSYTNTLLYAPLIEEYTFRQVAQDIFVKGTDGMRWDVGVKSSALFAAIHNFYRDDTNRVRYSKDSIPLLQFIGGLYFWKRQREAGIVHAVLAHSLTNACHRLILR